jgi:hypothetical protein
LEAEDYDVGGATFAYFDTDAANVGVQYRTQEAVDIEACSEGGFNVGWFKPSEWMEYTVQVPRTGRYELRVRLATPTNGCTYRASMDGVNIITPTFVIPTGGWQTFRSQRSFVDLTAGTRVLRFTNTSSGTGRDINLNWFELVVGGDCNGDGVADIEDLHAFESRQAVFADVDGDGAPYTAGDRNSLLSTLRASELDR